MNPVFSISLWPFSVHQICNTTDFKIIAALNHVPNPVTSKGKNWATKSDTAAQPLRLHRCTTLNLFNDDHSQLQYGKIYLNCWGVPPGRWRKYIFCLKRPYVWRTLVGEKAIQEERHYYLALERGHVRFNWVCPSQERSTSSFHYWFMSHHVQP